MIKILLLIRPVCFLNKKFEFCLVIFKIIRFNLIIKKVNQVALNFLDLRIHYLDPLEHVAEVFKLLVVQVFYAGMKLINLILQLQRVIMRDLYIADYFVF